MSTHQPLNYDLFRQQAVRQLRTGNPDKVDLRGLLAPVINDILEAVLLTGHTAIEVPKQLQPASVEQKPAVVSKQPVYEPRPNQHRRKLTDIIPRQLEEAAIDMYKRGGSYRAIQDRLFTWNNLFYEVDDLIQVTDQFLAQTMAWQNRPLRSVYVCLWITHKTCQLWQPDELVAKTVFTVVGVDGAGKRDILGYYVDHRSITGFLPHLLSNLKARGVEDVLIMCLDSVVELRETIREIYPHTQVHVSARQLIRSCLVHVRGKELTRIRRDLTAICQASTPDQVTELWQTVKTTWGAAYPLIMAQWEAHWPDLAGILEYPALVRNLTYGVSLVHISQELLDQGATVNGVNTTQTELLKSVYVTSIQTLFKHRMTINKWDLLTQQLSLVFGDRMARS